MNISNQNLKAGPAAGFGRFSLLCVAAFSLCLFGTPAEGASKPLSETFAVVSDLLTEENCRGLAASEGWTYWTFTPATPDGRGKCKNWSGNRASPAPSASDTTLPALSSDTEPDGRYGGPPSAAAFSAALQAFGYEEAAAQDLSEAYFANPKNAIFAGCCLTLEETVQAATAEHIAGLTRGETLFTKVAAAENSEEGERTLTAEGSAETGGAEALTDRFLDNVRTDIEALELEYADIEDGLSLLKEERRDNHRKARKELQARRYEAERLLFIHYRDFFNQAIRNKSISSAETLRLAAVIPALGNVEYILSEALDILSDGRQEAHFAMGVSAEQQAHDGMAAASAAERKKEEETITAFGLLDLAHEIHDVSEAVYDNANDALKTIVELQRNVQRELLTLYRRCYDRVVGEAENEECSPAYDLDCPSETRDRQGSNGGSSARELGAQTKAEIGPCSPARNLNCATSSTEGSGGE